MYSNWFLLTVFSSTRFSIMMTLFCNCGFFTSRAILNPYTTSRWILVASYWCNYLHNILPNINYQPIFVISRVDALYVPITDRFLCLFSIDNKTI
jgi:hypothetical protein